MTPISWMPGSGWAVVTTDFLIWLPGQSDTTIAAELYDLEGGRHDDAARLLAGKAASYAILRIGGEVSLQTRGAVRVRVWDAAGAVLTKDLAEACGATLGESAPDLVGFPIAGGVVACGSVTWRMPVDCGTPAKAGLDSVRPEPHPSVAAAGFIAQVPEFIAQVRDRQAEAEPNPFAELWGHTMRRPVEAAAVRVVRDSDAETEPPITHALTQSPDDSTPPPPSASPETWPRPMSSTTATLIGEPIERCTFDQEPDYGEVVASDGQRVPILDAVVVGRAPQPLPGQDCQLLRLASPERSISRSHVAIGVIDGVVRARDLGSNNGTNLVRGNQPIALATDSWTELTTGDLLDLGEDVTVRLMGLP